MIIKQLHFIFHMIERDKQIKKKKKKKKEKEKQISFLWLRDLLKRQTNQELVHRKQ